MSETTTCCQHIRIETTPGLAIGASAGQWNCTNVYDKMAGHRGIPHCQVANLGFHEQGLNFPPNIQVEMADTGIDSSTTSISVALEGQNLVREIVQNASDLFKTLQNCEVLNVEESGSKDRQQRLSTACQETLEKLKELFNQLRIVYEESTKRMPEVHQVLNTGNIEYLLPLTGDVNPMENGNMDVTVVHSVEKDNLVKEIQEKNKKIKVLIEKFRTLIQELNLIIQLETSQ